MTDLERFLREMGLSAPKPKPAPVERKFKGVWYRDGEVPH
jgi:hypothetical protein